MPEREDLQLLAPVTTHQQERKSTMKIYLVADRRCRPIARLTSPGQNADHPRLIPLMHGLQKESERRQPRRFQAGPRDEKQRRQGQLSRLRRSGRSGRGCPPGSAFGRWGADRPRIVSHGRMSGSYVPQSTSATGSRLGAPLTWLASRCANRGVPLTNGSGRGDRIKFCERRTVGLGDPEAVVAEVGNSRNGQCSEQPAQPRVTIPATPGDGPHVQRRRLDQRDSCGGAGPRAGRFRLR